VPMKKLRSKAFFIIFVYFVLLLTVRSTYVIEAFPALEGLSKYSTVLTYLPFAVAILWKLLGDLMHIKRTVSSVSNCIYYAFALYYVALCAYRFTHGMEIKENFYYTVVFLGAVAAYMLLRDGKIVMPKKDLDKNILWITCLFMLYRLAYVLIGAQFISKSPINLNLTSGAVAVLLPYVANLLTEPALEKKKMIFPWIVFSAGIIVIATTGARALFALTAGTVAVMLAVALLKRKGLLRILSALVLSCAVVVGMAVMNVGDVRYAIYRQTGIDISASLNVGTTVATTAPQTQPGTSNENPGGVQTPPSNGTTDTKDPADSSEPEEIVDPDLLKAQKQINASDRMRKRLMQWGIQQVKESPLFGTGDVMYWYQMNRRYGFMQSSHNFLIEAMVCYGTIGLVIMAALVIALLAEAKLFAKPLRYRWSYRVTILLTAAVYFAFGFVQPTVFDSLICPLFVLTIAACRKALHEPH